MSDKEYEEQKARVQKYIDKWFKPMGLGWYDISWVWNRQPRVEERKNSLSGAADCDASWEYRRAVINWYLPTIANIDDGALENVVIHEFCHILISSTDTDDLPPEKLEYATENVARAIQWAYEAGADKTL